MIYSTRGKSLQSKEGNLVFIKLIKIAEKNGIKFLETSAKETVNIEELFITTSKTFLEKQSSIGQKNPKKVPGNSISLNENNKPHSNNEGGCC